MRNVRRRFPNRDSKRFFHLLNASNQPHEAIFFFHAFPFSPDLFWPAIHDLLWTVDVRTRTRHRCAKPTDGISVEIEGGFMVPYVATIPGTDVQFEMIPVPGGTFKLGSDASEEGRGEDEGPQVEITLQPYWVGKTEVTWAEYKRFMGMYKIFKNLQSQRIRRVDASNRADAITVPTPLYEPSHTFEYGEDPQQPAVTMTQYAAKQYSKWVSGLTGQQYRLPTEAEWEYAAEAGNGGPYSFGDDTSALAEYASFADTNSTGASKVGSKKPNAFGLHDMHGNVWEWTVDGYSSSGFGDLTLAPRRHSSLPTGRSPPIQELFAEVDGKMEPNDVARQPAWVLMMRNGSRKIRTFH